MTPKALNSIMQNIRDCVRLQELSLAYSLVGKDADVAVPAIAQLTTLQRLDLSECQLHAGHIEALGPLLRGGGTLRDLTLKGNTMDVSECKALASIITDCTSLQSLSLVGCEMDSESAVPLTSALATTTSLQVLDVSHNLLGAPWMRSTSEALARLPLLRVFRASGASALARARASHFCSRRQPRGRRLGVRAACAVPKAGEAELVMCVVVRLCARCAD